VGNEGKADQRSILPPKKEFRIAVKNTQLITACLFSKNESGSSFAGGKNKALLNAGSRQLIF